MIFDVKELIVGKVLPSYLIVGGKELLEGYTRLLEYQGDSLTYMEEDTEVEGKSLLVKQRWLVQFVHQSEVDISDAALRITQTNIAGFTTHRYFTHNVGLFRDVWRKYYGEEQSPAERDFVDDDNYDGFF